ncbi:MAG TPA: hypothetical protein VJU18_04165 [Vicinamibacteria bacterium]|nr:hypothetical protein [Vicinamibacteria bacterium]
MRLERALLLPAFLSAAACIQGQRVVKVNLDGSGTIVDTVALTEQARGMLSSLEQMDKTSPAEKNAKKETKLKAAAATMGEGVSFVSLVAGKDGSEKITYAFRDVTKLKIDWAPSPSDNDAKPANNDVSFRFQRGGASSTLTVVQAHKPEKKDAVAKAKPTPQEMAQQAAMMREMMAGLKLSGVLEVNGRLLKTNSPYATGSRVTLLEIDFDQVAVDPASMAKLAEIDNPAKADPKLMAGVKGLKVNTLPELNIEFVAK